MIWASAVSGAALALISAILTTVVLGFPVWLSGLIYLVTSGIYTAIIFGVMLLHSNMKAVQKGSTDPSLSHDLHPSFEMAIVPKVLPHEK